MEWIKTAKKQFERFRYELKLEKRRKKEKDTRGEIEGKRPKIEGKRTEIKRKR